jgi:hypothetical protein
MEGTVSVSGGGVAVLAKDIVVTKTAPATTNTARPAKIYFFIMFPLISLKLIEGIN